MFQVPFLIVHPWLMALAGFLANGGQAIAALALVLASESAPTRLHATAIGLSTLVGEVVGAAFAPVFAGAIADRCGLAARCGSRPEARFWCSWLLCSSPKPRRQNPNV